jgi:hypothetical protein
MKKTMFIGVLSVMAIVSLKRRNRTTTKLLASYRSSSSGRKSDGLLLA